MTTRYDPCIARLRELAREPRPGFAAYASKVRDDPQRVTDADIAALRQQGFTEDEIFAETVAAATGAGLERLDLALQTLA